jgi:hypothetical protein
VEKTAAEFVLGLPRDALLVEPPFREYVINVDLTKVEAPDPPAP